jgi:hypothetical protein
MVTVRDDDGAGRIALVVTEPRRFDRARNNVDRHPNYILAAFMASAT